MKYILKRLLIAILTLWIIVTITFFLMQFLPGTPFAAEAQMTEEQIALMYEVYGLDRPLPVQYVQYLGNILTGNLGVSFQLNNTEVSSIISNRIGPSLQLGFQAMVVGSIIGGTLGIIAAVKKNTWVDSLAQALAITGRSVPVFVTAVLLQLVFAVTLGWFPIAFWSNGFSSTILPTLALSVTPMATTARIVRADLVEVLNSNYIELAYTKGLSKTKIIGKHALKNALISTLTLLGPLTASLITGSVIVENIFAIPGIGEQFIQSILTSDYPMIMGTTILFSTILVVVIFVTDIIYTWIDPRIQLEDKVKT